MHPMRPVGTVSPLRLLINQQGVRIVWAHVVSYCDGAPQYPGQVICQTVTGETLPIAVGLDSAQVAHLVAALDGCLPEALGEILNVRAFLEQFADLQAAGVYLSHDEPRAWSS